MKHTVGEMHPNGKWMWTEYKPGKFDWRAPKKETSVKDTEGENETAEQATETPASAPKARTKKQFIAETSRNLTKEECAEYWKLGKQLDVYVRSTWKYAIGKIGGCKLTMENCMSGKSKSFSQHPNWRPLGHYSFYVRGWAGESIEVEGFIQSWDEIQYISDTESFSVSLMKHPHQ